jgi:hypothetical protein
MGTVRSFAVSLFCVGVLLVGLGAHEMAFANGKVTETQYSTSLSEATGIVRIVVAVFGGLIGLLGIVVAAKGVAGKADVELSVSEHRSLSFKRISQGVVITVVGAGILVAALYLLPEKRTEREVTGTDITIERGQGVEKLRAKH